VLTVGAPSPFEICPGCLPPDWHRENHCGYLPAGAKSPLILARFKFSAKLLLATGRAWEIQSSPPIFHLHSFSISPRKTSSRVQHPRAPIGTYLSFPAVLWQMSRRMTANNHSERGARTTENVHAGIAAGVPQKTNTHQAVMPNLPRA
jgi:hypothetical protein